MYSLRKAEDAELLKGKITFKPKFESLDWKKIASIDIEKLIKEGDTSQLTELINSVIFCKADTEFDHGRIDPGFIKVFRISQLISESLLSSHESCAESLTTLQKKNNEAEKKKGKLSEEILHLKEMLTSAKKELRKRREMLAFSQNTDLLLGSNNNGSCDEYEQCPYCSKKFLTSGYLLAHIQRRHQGLPLNPLYPSIIPSGGPNLLCQHQYHHLLQHPQQQQQLHNNPPTPSLPLQIHQTQKQQHNHQGSVAASIGSYCESQSPGIVSQSPQLSQSQHHLINLNHQQLQQQLLQFHHVLPTSPSAVQLVTTSDGGSNNGGGGLLTSSSHQHHHHNEPTCSGGSMTSLNQIPSGNVNHGSSNGSHLNEGMHQMKESSTQTLSVTNDNEPTRDDHQNSECEGVRTTSTRSREEMEKAVLDVIRLQDEFEERWQNLGEKVRQSGIEELKGAMMTEASKIEDVSINSFQRKLKEDGEVVRSPAAAIAATAAVAAAAEISHSTLSTDTISKHEIIEELKRMLQASVQQELQVLSSRLESQEQFWQNKLAYVQQAHEQQIQLLRHELKPKPKTVIDVGINCDAEIEKEEDNPLGSFYSTSQITEEENGGKEPVKTKTQVATTIKHQEEICKDLNDEDNDSKSEDEEEKTEDNNDAKQATIIESASHSYRRDEHDGDEEDDHVNQFSSDDSFTMNFNSAAINNNDEGSDDDSSTSNFNNSVAINNDGSEDDDDNNNTNENQKKKSQVDLVRAKTIMELEKGMTDIGLNPESTAIGLEEMGRVLKHLKSKRRASASSGLLDGAAHIHDQGEFEEERNAIKSFAKFSATKSSIDEKLEAISSLNAKKTQQSSFVKIFSAVKISGNNFRKRVASAVKKKPKYEDEVDDYLDNDVDIDGGGDVAEKGDKIRKRKALKTKFFSKARWARKKEEKDDSSSTKVKAAAATTSNSLLSTENQASEEENMSSNGLSSSEEEEEEEEYYDEKEENETSESSSDDDENDNDSDENEEDESVKSQAFDEVLQITAVTQNKRESSLESPRRLAKQNLRWKEDESDIRLHEIKQFVNKNKKKVDESRRDEEEESNSSSEDDCLYDTTFKRN